MYYEPTFPILTDLGLSLNEAKIYELLVKNGAQKPHDLAKLSGIGRANVYGVLDQLKKHALVLELEGRQSRFTAQDPGKLNELLERKVKEAEDLKARFSGDLPRLLSAFNLATDRPSIRIFEGLDGVVQILNDSLTAKGEILTILDPAILTPEVNVIDDKYVAKRLRAKISKRILMPDTETAKKVMTGGDSELTIMRISKSLAGGFHTATEIYDTRVSLLSFSNERVISILIEDKNIAELFRVQFEALWGIADVNQAIAH
jgi:sugar-specific transcriptional regulator TrmB